jgi:hypothetical protein
MDQEAHHRSPEVTAADDGNGSRDPEQIREDIERTRQEVGETAAALAEKADVKAQARAKVDDVKERLHQATPDSAGEAASTATSKARQYRTPLLVAGVALAAFLIGRATASD